MNPLKKLAGDTAIYGISSILGRFLNYLLVPIHTSVFLTGDYGVITELYVFVAFLNVIYMFGLETAYFRFAASDVHSERSIFNTGFTFILGISLLSSVLLVAFASDIVGSMGYSGQEHFVYFFALIMAMDALFSLPFARLRREGKSKRFAAAKITGIFVNIGVNVFFLVFCYGIDRGQFLPGLQETIAQVYDASWNLEYVFLGNLLGSGIVVVFFLNQLKTIRLSIDRQYIGKMISFSYPLVFTGLAIVMNEKLSLLGLKYWLPEGFYPGYSNQQMIGIFGGVFKLAILMNLGIQAYRYAAEPFFFDQSEKKDSPELFARLLNWFVLFGCLLWMGVSFNLEWLQYFLRSEDYRMAIPIVPVLLLGSLFMGINYNLSAWYKLIDFTKAGTVITLFGGLVTIVLNYLLIPLYGYTGAAVAGVTAYASMTIVSYLWSRKRNPIPYSVFKIAVYLLISGVLVWFGMNYSTGGTFLDLVWRNALILVFIGSIFFINKKGKKPELGSKT